MFHSELASEKLDELIWQADQARLARQARIARHHARRRRDRWTRVDRPTR
jgi:hypothetical protein